MAGNYVRVCDLDASKEDWCILARVVRLWNVISTERGSPVSAIEMILVDEAGTQIQAAVRKKYVKKFDRILREGPVYSLRNFTVADNVGDHRTTSHQFKIIIQGETVAVIKPDNLVPVFPLTFASFEDIVGGRLDTAYLVDVMGLITGLGTERQYVTNGTRTKMNVIELENSGIKLNCALWGRYNDQLNQFLQAGDTETAVVAIFGVKIKEFQGRKGLQNALHCTKLLFNPTFQEAIDFKEGMLRNLTSPSQGISRINDTHDISYVVEATIKHVIDMDDWWYNACNACNKAVYPDSVAYYCGDCDRRVVNVKPRYRIKVRVIDDTDSTTFVIFDRPAAGYFNRTCSEMIEMFEKHGGELVCPRDISDLVDKKFLFKMDMRNLTVGRFEPSYKVQ
ncbi:replication protein A 70 kDa DNA-binding subunit B-like [Lotus japonicus]|uniref:replication protein A 70 kDa DNA-binding subunit B-like n=1 Tax=Lotus japonicus TaxID=34305 RepID=UPI0025833AC5|nr:replication protein A 70 kDa DNA-binding subunit B-like [Lotus japonicus]XP_057432189.1 replication protein A 70 kDa DNA-binding subunit B-like [Lotus japonicus]XP_057432711.1 replication protein A 70 kDa DNA-binding subunit B-like [Lotus japonicus]XP_057451785.1 replication protein A 70 kDa DNA-binding subunit B-like [Lotus japonicus]